jgi:CBS domain containing-hemolysin-like protein
MMNLESLQTDAILGGILLLLLGFLATIDTAVSKLSDIQLRRLMSEAEEESKVRFAENLKIIIRDRGRFRFIFSIAMQTLQIAFTVLVTTAAITRSDNGAPVAVYAVLASIGFSLLIRQILPYLILRPNPEGALGILLPIAGPFYGFFNSVASRFQRPEAEADEHLTVSPNKATEDEDEDETDHLQALIDIGEAEGIIEEEERELIETMVNFSDTRAAEIMTPRTEICALPIDATVRQARDLMIEEKYSRVPVYKDNIDNIQGVIYIRDLLTAWAEDKEDRKIASMLRQAYFVPETIFLSELMKKMQAAHVQIGIVIDEYGGVAGLISLEDIVEELVGEIEDEDTEAEEVVEVVEVAEDCYDVVGWADIDLLEKLFDIEMEEADFTTIAGMVTSESGYVPKEGETLEMHGLSVEVLKADEKRISLVRLRRVGGQGEPEENPRPSAE